MSDLTFQPFPRFFGNTEPACHFLWGVPWSVACVACFRCFPCTLSLSTSNSHGSLEAQIPRRCSEGIPLLVNRTNCEDDELTHFTRLVFKTLSSDQLFPLPTPLFQLTASEWLLGPGKEVLNYVVHCNNPIIAASISPFTPLHLWHPSSMRRQINVVSPPAPAHPPFCKDSVCCSQGQHLVLHPTSL